jgi:hypothetical protein
MVMSSVKANVEMNSFYYKSPLPIPGDVITLYEMSELLAQPEKKVTEDEPRHKNLLCNGC